MSVDSRGSMYHTRPSKGKRARGISRTDSVALDPDARWVEEGYTDIYEAAAAGEVQPYGTCYFQGRIIAVNVSEPVCLTDLGGDQWESDPAI